MNDDQFALLREHAAAPDAPPWLPALLAELDRLRARLEQLEQENRALSEQLSFFRSRVAA